MFFKNSPRWYARFIAREIIYNLYVLLTEPSVLKVLPEMCEKLPAMRARRSRLRRQRAISLREAERLLD